MNATKAKRGKTLLVHFISDLLRNERLEQKVIEDPRGAMKSYGLTGGQIRTLKTQSKTRIKEAIIDEIERATRHIVRQDPEV